MSSTTNSKEAKSESVKPVVVTAASESLGVLEEDDEFEEFAAADWDDAQTDLAHLGGAAPGAAKSAGDKLWEDNWDDDDIEDDFSVQLRSELAKTKGSDAMET
ncbi:DSS1/SEM1 family-domain-containing protein [Ephemerocybe angulata]|uniref:26S proteasome complex subunit SEM1 n=1 Tax=Ephemerocybe angulata TaxID=980116 RepID=A0A8H6LX49_9AGAR|nr:DSS1/SEM1 family-domain-containing protein [Tulosesus angulatus]